MGLKAVCKSCKRSHDNCTVWMGFPYCPSCINVVSRKCSRCGQRVPVINDSSLGGYRPSGPFLCGECDGSRNDYSGQSSEFPVCNYSYKPSPIFHFSAMESRSADRLFLGAELETVKVKNVGKDRTSTASDIMSKYSNRSRLFYLKNDGSIGSNGFELVTHPCTILYHANEFPWDAVAGHLVENGFASHNTNTCGLHVHMSKRFFSYSDLIKLGLFFHHMRQYLRKFGRRDNSEYAVYRDSAFSYKGKIHHIPFAGAGGVRYDAINFGRLNAKTVEIRLFRGTLITRTIISTLQLCDCIGKFVKDVPLRKEYQDIVSGHEGIMWNRFVQYADSMGKTYRTMLDYIDELELSKVGE